MTSILDPFRNVLSPAIYQVPVGTITIDWENPLTTGLIGCWIPGVMGGTNIAGTGVDLAADITTAQQYPLSNEGPGYGGSQTNGASLSGLATGSFLSQSEMTMYWRGQLPPTNPTGTYTTFASFIPTAGTTDILVLRNETNPAPGGFANCFLRSNSNGGAVAVSIGDLSGRVGTSFGIAGSYKTGGNLKSYVAGVFVAQTALALQPSMGTNPAVRLNAWTSSSSLWRSGNQISTLLCFWNRQLTDGEIAALELSPYSFLISSEYELPMLFIPSAPTPDVIYAFDQVGAHITRKITSLGY